MEKEKNNNDELNNATSFGYVFGELAYIQGLCETIIELLPNGKMDATKAMIESKKKENALRIERLLLRSANRKEISE